jgi:hypothetical protein
MNTSVKNSINLLLITNEPKAKFPKPSKRRVPKRIGKPEKRKSPRNGIFGIA